MSIRSKRTSDEGEQSWGKNRKNLGNTCSDAMSEQNERGKEEQMHGEKTRRCQFAICNTGNSDGVNDLDPVQNIRAHIFQEAVPAFSAGYFCDFEMSLFFFIP